MYFRLATGRNGGQELAGGVGNLFSALAMGPIYQAQAAEEARTAQAKMDLMDAQQRQADAHAALFQQQGGQLADQRQRGTLGGLIGSAAMLHNVPTEAVPDLTQVINTGQMPGQYTPAPDGMGPVLPRPAYLNPENVAKVMRDIGVMQQALTVGDKSVENVAKAGQIHRNQSLSDRVLSGQLSAGQVGQAQAAAEGKKLIDSIGTTGEGFNQFTGDAVNLNPGLRALFDLGQRAEVRQRNAAASNSLASAGQHQAQTRKINQDIEQGVRNGDLQVVTGTDGAITVVNKRTLQAQPVLDAQGRPVLKGAAGGGGKPMTEGQAKANLFGGRMTESDRILSDLEAKGILRPGNIKSVAEGAGRIVGFGTESVGGTLADMAGAATNWTQSSAQQKVEQARRDFINAVLRRESGAVISPQEFANAERQYFPQPGDSKQVIEQKRRNRQLATTLMLQEVPEAHRHRAGAAPSVAPAASGGATGSWAPDGGQRTVQVDY